MAETEQITAVPKEEAPVRVKDPKKVAAGKALAARNKAAREAQKKLKVHLTSINEQFYRNPCTFIGTLAKK